MAHTRHGTNRGCASHFNWVATLARIIARDPKIWFPFPHYVHLGSSGRAVRRAAIYLRHAGFFDDRLAHRRAIEHRHSSVFDRTRASVDSAAARFADRNAGGDSECDSWVVGHFRHDSMAAGLSVSIPQALPRLDPIFHWADLRAQHARWWNHYCNHDSANHHFGLTRDFAQCSELAARGRLRAWCNALGSHTDRSAQLRQEGLVRRGHPRSRARSRRNDGGDDGDRQHATDRSVAFQTWLHVG